MKGLVFISSSEIVLRFFGSGAFDALEEEHDLTYIVLQSSDLLLQKDLQESVFKGRKVRWIPLYLERFRRWNEQFDISCMVYQDRSSSFAVRYQEQKRQDPQRFIELEKKARPGGYEKQREASESYMGINPDMLNLVMDLKPDFFVLPSALLDYITDDVLQLADALKVPTLMLVSGWDNLSSKGLIYHQPTMIGVWGEQSRDHAVSVQNASPDAVHVVGCPHYENFRSSEEMDRGELRKGFGLPVDGHVVLFAGTLRLFDETQLLKELDRAIETGLLPPMKILYRPHPWRDARRDEDDFFQYEWRHITMDAQIADTYKATKATNQNSTSDNFLFRMQHLPRLYRAVDALISPMSTVLLEGLLFGLPTMAVAFNDGKHSWSADKVSRMMHFKELYDVPGLIVCRDRNQFFPQLKQLIAKIGDVEFSSTLRKHTGFFVHQDDRSYGERVAALVEKMLAETTDKPNYQSAKVRPGKTLEGQHVLRKVWQQSAIGRQGSRVYHGIRRRVIT